MYKVAAVAVQNGAEVVESAGDIDIGNIDVPVLMNLLLTEVITDVVGETGQKIIRAMLASGTGKSSPSPATTPSKPVNKTLPKPCKATTGKSAWLP
ncbi:MAG: hypothetical protein ACRERV_08140 [Methylococcales bacterium]